MAVFSSPIAPCGLAHADPVIRMFGAKNRLNMLTFALFRSNRGLPGSSL